MRPACAVIGQQCLRHSRADIGGIGTGGPDSLGEVVARFVFGDVADGARVEASQNDFVADQIGIHDNSVARIADARKRIELRAVAPIRESKQHHIGGLVDRWAHRHEVSRVGEMTNDFYERTASGHPRLDAGVHYVLAVNDDDRYRALTPGLRGHVPYPD
jgi:hypothetical protein